MDEAERLMFEGWATLPQFKRKVAQTQKIIQDALKIAPAYVACSWGKDSTVLVHLCQQVDPNVPVIFWTDPEQEILGNYSSVIQRYCQKFSPNYREIDTPGDRVPEKLEISRIWEEYPMAIVGIRKEEGGARRHAVKYGLIHRYRSGSRLETWRAWPLLYWTWRDVWAYILAHQIPYLSAYDHPLADHKSVSRTCNLFAKKRGNTKGLGSGRIENLRRINPEYYGYLKSNFPGIGL